VLEPLTVSAKVQLNLHPENSNFDTPMVKLDVSIGSLNAAWHTCQVSLIGVMVFTGLSALRSLVILRLYSIN